MNDTGFKPANTSIYSNQLIHYINEIGKSVLSLFAWTYAGFHSKQQETGREHHSKQFYRKLLILFCIKFLFS